MRNPKIFDVAKISCGLFMVGVLYLFFGIALVSADDEDLVLQEIKKLPFKNIIWHDKIDNEKILRLTIGYEHIFVETDANRLYAVNKSDSAHDWMVQLDAPLQFPPAEASNLPQEISQLEKNVDEYTQRIADQEKKEGPDPQVMGELQKKIETASADTPQSQIDEWKKLLEEEGNRKGVNTKKIQELKMNLHAIKENLSTLKKMDRVYLYSKGTLISIYRKYGKIAWQNGNLGFVPSAPPAATESDIFIPSLESSRVFRLDAEKNGKIITSYKAEEEALENVIETQPIYNGSLYFASRSGKIYCYDITHNKLQENWPFKTRNNLKVGPVIHKYNFSWLKGNQILTESVITFLFVGAMDKTFYALDANGGNLLWKYAIDGSVSTPPIAKDSNVYVKTDNGYLYVFNVFPVHKDEKGNFMNKVIVDENEKPIYEIQWKRSGELRWKKPLWERFLLKGKDKIYCLGPENDIYAVDEISGEIKGCYEANVIDFILTNTVDDTFYCGTKSGHIFAIKESPIEPENE